MNHYSETYVMIEAFLKNVLQGYKSIEKQTVATDFHLQASRENGELRIFNDDDILVSSLKVEEWCSIKENDFGLYVERLLIKVLNNIYNSGFFDEIRLIKPFSFVLIDECKETITDLLLVDDLDILFLEGELLKGLDDELNSFLDDLLTS